MRFRGRVSAPGRHEPVAGMRALDTPSDRSCLSQASTIGAARGEGRWPRREPRAWSPLPQPPPPDLSGSEARADRLGDQGEAQQDEIRGHLVSPGWGVWGTGGMKSASPRTAQGALVVVPSQPPAVTALTNCQGLAIAARGRRAAWHHAATAASRAARSMPAAVSLSRWRRAAWQCCSSKRFDREYIRWACGSTPPVGGHEILPIGGQETPRQRPANLPMGGQEASPVV